MGGDEYMKMKIPLRLVVILLFFNCNEENKMKTYNWPSWNDYKAVVGRVATKEDVNDGKAGFVLEAQGKSIGIPIDFPLPQYAMHIDAEKKTETPCIVIQAEQANDNKIIACYLLPSNELLVGLFYEFKLLGQDKPK